MDTYTTNNPRRRFISNCKTPRLTETPSTDKLAAELPDALLVLREARSRRLESKGIQIRLDLGAKEFVVSHSKGRLFMTLQDEPQSLEADATEFLTILMQRRN